LLGQKFNRENPDIVEQSRRSGTCFDRADALHEMKAILRTVGVEEPPASEIEAADEEEEDPAGTPSIPQADPPPDSERSPKKEEDRLKDCLTFVRRPIDKRSKRTQRSHDPVEIPVWRNIGGNDTIAAGTSLLLSALGNVRPLHRNLNESNWGKKLTSDEKDVVEAIQFFLRQEIKGKYIGSGQKVYAKVDTIDKDLHRPPRQVEPSTQVPDNEDPEARDDEDLPDDPAADHGASSESEQEEDDPMETEVEEPVDGGENRHQRPRPGVELDVDKVLRIPKVVAEWIASHSKRTEIIGDPSLETGDRDGGNGEERIDNLIFGERTTKTIRLPPMSIRNGRFTLVFAANIRQSSEEIHLEILTRWNEKEKWSRLLKGKEQDIEDLEKWDDGERLTKGTYNFLIYERTDRSYIERELLGFNLTGGQNKVRCSIHQDSGFLAHWPFNKEKKVLCCDKDGKCKNQGSWRCTFLFGNTGCQAAVCEKHMKERRQLVAESDVIPRPYPDEPDRDPEDEENIFEESDPETGEIDDIYEVDLDERERQEEEEEAELATDLMTLGDEPETGNRPEVQPLFGPAEPDGTTPNIRGRFMLNYFARVLSRFGQQQRGMPRALQCLIQSIYARNPDSQVSLNFFESVLFPLPLSSCT
jgi:hypothetical protein